MLPREALSILDQGLQPVGCRPPLNRRDYALLDQAMVDLLAFVNLHDPIPAAPVPPAALPVP